MTTGTGPDRGSVAQRQAVELLGVDASASPAEVRRAYYRKLREYDFLPPPSLQRALRVLDSKPGRAEVDADWLLEEERRLRAEIESFADDFFRLPVVERGERWDELFFRCPDDSPLRGRLKALEAGLTIEPRTLPSDLPCRGELADHLLESFPLPPLAQAASRQAFLRRIEGSSVEERGDWERASRYLLFEWPAVGALDRELLDHIANLSSRLRVRKKMHLSSVERPQTIPNPGGEGSTPWLLDPFREGCPWWVVPVCVAVIGLLGAVLRTNNSSSTKTPSPSFAAPQVPPWPSPDQLPRIARPIHELLDSPDYDVEVLDAGKSRLLCFTRRSESKEPGTGAAAAIHGRRQYFYGEATLRLQGFSEDEVNAIFFQAEKRKRAELTGPRKSTGGDRTRP